MAYTDTSKILNFHDNYKDLKSKKNQNLDIYSSAHEDSRWLHANVSKMTAYFNGRTLLCDIVVVLHIAVFLR